MATAVSARTLFSPRQRAENVIFGDRWGVLFERAVAVGSAAAGVALRLPGSRPERVYLGGLLHDVGMSLGLRALAGLVVDSRVTQPDPSRLERVLDKVHVQIGAEAHQAWNLPQYLTVLCVRHHEDEVPADPEFADLHVVRLVSALEDLRRSPASAGHAAVEVAQSAAVLRVDPLGARALVAELRTTAERVARTFPLGQAEHPSSP